MLGEFFFLGGGWFNIGGGLGFLRFQGVFRVSRVGTGITYFPRYRYRVLKVI